MAISTNIEHTFIDRDKREDISPGERPVPQENLAMRNIAIIALGPESTSVDALVELLLQPINGKSSGIEEVRRMAPLIMKLQGLQGGNQEVVGLTESQYQLVRERVEVATFPSNDPMWLRFIETIVNAG